MPWTNGPLALFHGTDDTSARSIVAGGVRLAHGKDLTDFGKGFYTTSNLAQAKNWANMRCRVLARGTGSVATAVVLELRVDRNALANLQSLVFVTENTSSDFWDLIRVCRTTRPPTQAHRTPPPNHYYDVVYGPVSLWPQTLVIKDCDQVSFHTAAAEALLRGVAPSPLARGTPLFV